MNWVINRTETFFFCMNSTNSVPNIVYFDDGSQTTMVNFDPVRLVAISVLIPLVHYAHEQNLSLRLPSHTSMSVILA